MFSFGLSKQKSLHSFTTRVLCKQLQTKTAFALSTREVSYTVSWRFSLLSLWIRSYAPVRKVSQRFFLQNLTSNWFFASMRQAGFSLSSRKLCLVSIPPKHWCHAICKLSQHQQLAVLLRLVSKFNANSLRFFRSCATNLSHRSTKHTTLSWKEKMFKNSWKPSGCSHARVQGHATVNRKQNLSVILD